MWCVELLWCHGTPRAASPTGRAGMGGTGGSKPPPYEDAGIRTPSVACGDISPVRGGDEFPHDINR
jgi:hypothetical protein